MKFQFDNERPIYLQLLEQLELRIVSGLLTPGERLPSVRDLALQAKANPNTVQKALAELEASGLIFTERTNGKFVTNDQKLIKKYREQFAATKTQKYLQDMSDLGFKNHEIIEYFTKKGVINSEKS